MTADRADRVATGVAYVLIGLSFVVGFLALVDWCADGDVIPVVGKYRDALPHLARLAIVCLGCGVLVMFGFYWWMVRSAVDIDPHDDKLNEIFDNRGHR